MKHLLEQGYEVYSSVTDNSYYDMLIFKEGQVFRVEVKSTRTKSFKSDSWTVQIKGVRANKTENKLVRFDNSDVDFLAIYIEPEDRVILLDAKSVTQKCAIQIKALN